jgi:hypothetical protein
MIDALVFPHTRLSAVFAPLTLVFRPAILSPSEGGQACGCSPPDCPCQVIQPPPLGSDLPRFQSLVADITEKGAAEGMSRLLLDARAQEAGRYFEAESSRKLAASINEAAKSGAARHEEDLLWNERLLLALAEFADNEEAGVNESWQQLDGRYRQMLAGLRGDDEPALPPPAPIADGGPRLTQYIGARLKAWSRLYFASNTKPMPVWLCLEAAADEIFEMRTARIGNSGTAVVELGEIALPSRLDAENRAKLAGLTELTGRLAELLANGNNQPGDFPAFADTWQQRLDELSPGGNRGFLRFYDLGAMPAGAALGGAGEVAASGRILAVWRPGV